MSGKISLDLQIINYEFSLAELPPTKSAPGMAVLGKFKHFNLSGHGHFDMTAYDDYLAGKIKDYEYPQELIDESIASLEKLLAK